MVERHLAKTIDMIQFNATSFKSPTKDEAIQLQRLFIRVAIDRGMLAKRGDQTLTPLLDYLGEEYQPLPPMVV